MCSYTETIHFDRSIQSEAHLSQVAKQCVQARTILCVFKVNERDLYRFNQNAQRLPSNSPPLLSLSNV